MAVRFREENHTYESIDPNEKVDWLSVTKFVGLFKPKFDPVERSEKSSKNPRSKWYKVPPEKIREIWERETKRSTDLGTWYHKEREKDICDVETINRAGRPIPIVKPLQYIEEKIAPEQRLSEGIYPEHFMYLKSVGLCGQSDRVEVIGDMVDIFDYKTNKEISTAGFKSWDGTVAKMAKPIQHLDDCHLVHYGLQLSTYLYMILKHNPLYKPGKLWIHHVTFKNCGYDEFGYPVVCRDDGDNPIPEKVVPYEVPYYRKEVEAMIKYLKKLK
jgi:hypothetical protein